GRCCRPISSTSSKPAVVTRVTRAPFRSSSAFVATVEPCRTRVPRPHRARASAASTAAAGSPGVDGSLNASRRPPLHATTSVNVTPVSMPTAWAARSLLLDRRAPTPPPALEREHEHDDHDERDERPRRQRELVAEPGEEREVGDAAQEHGEEVSRQRIAPRPG